MRVPYAELGKVFWIKHQSYCFSLSEIALYFYLLDSCNDGRWENPFALRTKKIISDLGLKDDSITNAKRRLKSVGLIDFDTIQGSKFSHYQFPNLPIKSETFPQGLAKNDAKFRQSSDKVPANLPIKSASLESDTILDKKKDKDKDKETPTPLVILPFENDEFKTAWQEWLDFKAEIKDSYKTELSKQKALEKLIKISKKDCETAIAIIDQSIEKGWQGLFALKEEKNAPQTGGRAPNGQTPPEKHQVMQNGIKTAAKELIQEHRNGEATSIDWSKF